MSLGQFVFPTALVGAFIVLASFVASNPAQPSGTDPGQRLLRIEPGDSVQLEMTGFYGEAGHVFLSTQEERWQTGRLDAFEGPAPPQYQVAPIEYTVNPDADEELPGLDGALLNRRFNESFHTAKFPPQFSFGTWDETKSFPRSPQPFDRTVTFDRTTNLGGGRAFNLTLYLQFWENTGYRDLKEGSEYPCEGNARWTCRITALDEANGSITYQRLVDEGDPVPLEVAFEGVPVRAAGDATADVDESADEFTIVWTPVVGDKFQVRQGVPGFLDAGSYWVESVQATTFTAKYTRNAFAPTHLIGEPTWYDVVVVKILRAPTEPSPAPPNQ